MIFFLNIHTYLFFFLNFFDKFFNNDCVSSSCDPLAMLLLKTKSVEQLPIFITILGDNNTAGNQVCDSCYTP